jgi:flagellar motility protein MotE (MotC chaperone)
MMRAGHRSILWILALFLASSGALRVGSEAGSAFANAAPENTENAGPSPALSCPEPPLALAEALSAREKAVSTKEAALEERLAALSLTETAVAGRLDALQSAETRLRDTLALADGAAEGDLTKLTAVYETMKPKDAAKLFEAMTPDFAAGFLGRMRPDAAAAVMSGMSPEAGYAVSVILAGRNADVPKQ